ncbi:polyadenylate-binding protein-interacting protein 1 isoform X2 [Neocloeon triangulifer]|uniref:polyadenylate-binding protein-interacting protein 1 isoform X2 n=1 Tax=Neocloeon triangulifer TaxID=2078957 RepID=UPI00286F2CE4|nr:polyadenylate-binding protein-interacting protein 1 isoform X2 [Neocloeon triangulifer]
MADESDLAKNSNLSADAQEFYPRGYGAMASPNSSQHAIPLGFEALAAGAPGFPPMLMPWANGSADPADYHCTMQPMYMGGEEQRFMMVVPPAASFVPAAVPHRPMAAPSNPSSHWSSKSGPTELLRSAMSELTVNPGEFDNLVMPLGDTFCQWLTEPEVITSAIGLILEHSIMEPNFRYNGARLCNLLNNLDNTEDGSAFRNILLERCHQENEQVKELIEADPKRLHSFTLFLAELFIQLETKKGTGAKISVLGQELYEDLKLLLSSPNDDNVKCACQVLKLAGMHLEQEVDSASMDQLEELLTQAQSCPNLKPNMAILAKSVINLRHQTWGRSPPSPAQPQWSSADGASHQSNHFTNEPVYYGPDGQILTAEESRFLQEGLNANKGGDDDEGMDEELQDAYEQFLQMAPNSK